VQKAGEYTAAKKLRKYRISAYFFRAGKGTFFIEIMVSVSGGRKTHCLSG
jgi:hypothetical protein